MAMVVTTVIQSTVNFDGIKYWEWRSKDVFMCVFQSSPSISVVLHFCLLVIYVSSFGVPFVEGDPSFVVPSECPCYVHVQTYVLCAQQRQTWGNWVVVGPLSVNGSNPLVHSDQCTDE